MGRKPARVLAPPGPKTLLVVAGLPRPTASTIVGTIGRTRPDVNVVAAPFGQAAPAMYGEEAIRTLLTRACRFALQDLKGSTAPSIPSPNRLLLAYVVGSGWERLIEAFGVSAMPLPLDVEGWGYPKGKEWREIIEVVEQTVLGALADSTEMWRPIRSRLEARSSTEPLLLPLRNFEAEETTLFEDVMDVLLQRAEWDDILEQVNVARFPTDALPTYYRRLGGANKRFPVDRRGLVFASSLTGRHGPTRRLPSEPAPDAAKLRGLLETLFRLGTPLLDGHQHDVQWPNDRALDEVEFLCTVEGHVDVSGTHANVYPNDFVRAGENGRKVKGGH